MPEAAILQAGTEAYQASLAATEAAIASRLQAATEALAPALGSETASLVVEGLFEAVKLELGKEGAARQARSRANQEADVAQADQAAVDNAAKFVEGLGGTSDG